MTVNSQMRSSLRVTSRAGGNVPGVALPAQRAGCARCKACGCWLKIGNLALHADEKCRNSPYKRDGKYWYYVANTRK
ncbi:hypothetical protein AURDEDRAFT_174188 [Auricularia subglabra TFB-10046 SS5]|nr:hypothetical protein AURDEDRAFT_174188 [Auricularia subglabra TFB-10046 SS5]